MSRIAKGLALARGCLAIVRQVPVLLVPGVVHALSVVAVLIALLPQSPDRTLTAATAARLFVALLVTTAVGVLCAAVVVAVTADRMRGGSAGLRDGVALTRQHLPALLTWSLVSATVGTVLRVLEERLGPFGRWVTTGVGVLFSVGTLLVVPVLVLEDARPLPAALRRSAALFRQRWGEAVVGDTGLGLVLGAGFGLLALFVVAPLAALSTQAAVVGVVVVVALLGATSSTCTAVLSTALHRTAAGSDGGPFGDLSLLFAAPRSRHQASYAGPHGQWDAS